MRTVAAIGAIAWFLIATIAIGDGSDGTIGEPPDQQLIGDPVVMAIHLVARILFVGLAILSLMAVDWDALGHFLRDRAPTPDEPAS